MNKNEFKDTAYGLVSAVARALGNAHRLELLELLASGPKNVERLAREARMSVANTSQHLQKLLQWRLVKTRRLGTTIYYRLADRYVTDLLIVLHRTAAGRLSELENTIRKYRKQYGTDKAVIDALPAGEAFVLLDVRPETEYRHSHHPGAVNIPYYRLREALSSLDKSRLIVAYCRGRLCTYADEAVQRLRQAGYRAVRLEEAVMNASA